MQVRKSTATDAAALSTVGSVVQQLHYEQRPDWFKPVRIEELEPFYVELLGGPRGNGVYCPRPTSGIFPKRWMMIAA